MKIAYVECFSGLSGDMFLGALLDAGLAPKVLEDTVAALNVGARLEVSRVVRSGIAATKLDVWVGNEKDRPREAHEHGHSHVHSHEHGHEHLHGHKEDDGHPERAASASSRRISVQEHHHRGLKEIRDIISRAGISATAKQRAIAIFEALGAAEAKIHDTSIDKIHFHEVGAVDAIVDITCAAVGAESLGVERWIFSPLNVGGGAVDCAHGTFPVPAPATAELLKNAPVYSGEVKAELVTPTGAAIAHVMAAEFREFPRMAVEKIGYGAGTRDFPHHPNVVRISIGESLEAHDLAAPVETISVLEANLDDLNPQLFGYVVERALAAGALDVFGAPVQMKKNRPGMLLTVLCRPGDRDRLARLIFTETTTLGIRMREEHRATLVRRTDTIETRWGAVRMKVANLNGTVANFAPEYEDCRRIAEQHALPLKHVMQEVTRLYLDKQNG
jgi:uncharacterized protein (TIGR00299 family) protein